MIKYDFDVIFITCDCFLTLWTNSLKIIMNNQQNNIIICSYITVTQTVFETNNFSTHFDLEFERDNCLRTYTTGKQKQK